MSTSRNAQDHCSGPGQLNIHSKASLYEKKQNTGGGALRPPSQAAASALRWAYTPKNGVAIWRSPELGPSMSQCLTARFPTNKPSSRKIAAWSTTANANTPKGKLALHTPNARTNSGHLYPSSRTESGTRWSHGPEIRAVRLKVPPEAALAARRSDTTGDQLADNGKEGQGRFLSKGVRVMCNIELTTG